VAFTVSFPDLVDFDSVVAYAIVNYPKQLLPVFEEALQVCQAKLLLHQPVGRVPTSSGAAGNSGAGASALVPGTVKPHCPVRIVSLPPMLTKHSKSSIFNTLSVMRVLLSGIMCAGTVFLGTCDDCCVALFYCSCW
jgi:hypothetical protein